jgi:hypothetical protein
MPYVALGEVGAQHVDHLTTRRSLPLASILVQQGHTPA